MQSTSLTIEWHNWGLCSSDDIVLERTTISRASSTIHVKHFNGRQDLIHDELVRVNADEIYDLFVLIDQVMMDTEAWIPDYSVDVCDGFMWNMYVRQGRSTPIKIHGTVEPPPFGPDIEKSIRKMLQRAGAAIDPELFCACR